MGIGKFQNLTDVIDGHAQPDRDSGDCPRRKMCVLAFKSKMSIRKVHVRVPNKPVLTL